MKPKRPKVRTLEELRPLIREGRYRVGSHAVRHANCEGFTERDMVSAILYGRELLRYWQDQRLLALGYIRPSADIQIPLHVVIEYKKTRWIDIVTAFIPEEAHRVVSRGRLAEMLRHDRHEVKSRFVGPALG